MIAFALLFLLATPVMVPLIDGVWDVPAGDWRYLDDDLDLHQLPVRVTCSYEVLSGSGQVRLALMRSHDVKRLSKGQPHGVVAITQFATRGELRHEVHDRGEYAVMIDNRGEGANRVRVHLTVGLDFGREVTYVPPGRRLAVILISFAVFFGIVTWSARRLLSAIRS